MKLDELARRRDLLSLALVGTAGAALLLALALAWCAIRPRPVIVLRGAEPPRELVPGAVPDAAAAAFALLTVYEFDNYTPGTIEAATKALKTRLSARTWSQAAEGLDRRLRVIEEGRLSSHLAADPEVSIDRSRPGALRATVRGRRRVFIADRLSREESVTYRLELEPCPPTAGNPHGLAVVSQAVEEEPDAVRR